MSGHQDFAGRFWPKVDVRGPDECWPWTASRNIHNYGRLGRGGGGGEIGAHRASWMINRGEIPAGLFVCHRCDNPPCCNPAHLFLGTSRDNTRDMVSKGRANGRRVLTPDVVREVRRLLPSKTHSEIAARFGIGRSTVQHIKRGRTWGAVQ